MDESWAASNFDEVNWLDILGFGLAESFQPDYHFYASDCGTMPENSLLDAGVCDPPSSQDYLLRPGTLPVEVTGAFTSAQNNDLNASPVPAVDYQAELVPQTTLPNIAVHSSNNGLNARLQQALEAVRKDNEQKQPPLAQSRPVFDRFRINLPQHTGNADIPKVKRQRMKRSLGQPCLLCKYLKLKCSPGRPCAKCIEKHLGREDLAFTHCLRDHPSKFNPFIDIGNNPLGNDQDCHDIGMLCRLASNTASKCNSPSIFIWLFSYICYIRAHEPLQREGLLSKPGATSFWRHIQSQLSQDAFHELEGTFGSRCSNQNKANKYGRSLIIALSLFAWLGAAARRIRQQLAWSEEIDVCQRYLSEYIDLLMPRCMPGLSSVMIRNLMWTMHDLMIFPAVPQLKIEPGTLRQMHCEVELAVKAYGQTLLRVITGSSSKTMDVWALGEFFRESYWPRWDSGDPQDDLEHSASQIFPMFTEAKQKSMLWYLKPRETEFWYPRMRNEFESCLRFHPHLVRVKSWLEWMDDAQKILSEL